MTKGTEEGVPAFLDPWPWSTAPDNLLASWEVVQITVAS